MNFFLQREITNDLSVTAAYVGASGHRWPTIRDYNYPAYGPGATAANLNDRRPIQPQPQTYSSISIIESVINNAYHGLQISAEKRASRYFSVKGFYTFSKALEGGNEAAANGNTGMQNHRNVRAERGRTNSDRRHNAAVSAIWNVDYFNGANPVLRGILNHWSVSAIMTAKSGAPFTVNSGRDNNLDGNNNDRADLLGNPRLSPNRSRSEVSTMWFNAAAFAQSGAGQDGTSERNILDKPGSKNVDLGLFRDFKITEDKTLQFRSEMTNAFNLVNLKGPNVNPQLRSGRNDSRSGVHAPGATGVAIYVLELQKLVGKVHETSFHTGRIGSDCRGAQTCRQSRKTEHRPSI